jgi:hypothetical protein
MKRNERKQQQKKGQILKDKLTLKSSPQPPSSDCLEIRYAQAFVTTGLSNGSPNMINASIANQLKKKRKKENELKKERK